jgi:hypothetical protein
MNRRPGAPIRNVHTICERPRHLSATFSRFFGKKTILPDNISWIITHCLTILPSVSDCTQERILQEMPQTFSLKSLSLVPASMGDADTISEIAALVSIHNYARFDRGFLFYTLSRDEYAERICNGELVLLLSFNGNPIGYLCARQTPWNVDSTTEEGLAEAVVRAAKSLGVKDYLMVDQFVILPEYQDCGFGEAFAYLLSKEHEGPFFADMLEQPLRNPRIAYWHRRGVEKVGEFTELPPDRFLREESDTLGSSTLTWGIYFLEKGAFVPQRLWTSSPNERCSQPANCDSDSAPRAD